MGIIINFQMKFATYAALVATASAQCADPPIASVKVFTDDKCSTAVAEADAKKFSDAIVAQAKASVAATATPWGMKGVGTCMALTAKVGDTASVKATCVKDKITIAEYTDAKCATLQA